MRTADHYPSDLVVKRGPSKNKDNEPVALFSYKRDREKYMEYVGIIDTNPNAKLEQLTIHELLTALKNNSYRYVLIRTIRWDNVQHEVARFKEKEEALDFLEFLNANKKSYVTYDIYEDKDQEDYISFYNAMYMTNPPKEDTETKGVNHEE